MTAQIPGLTDEQISALEMLAGHPDGCPESEMKANGFTIGLLGGLTRPGLAPATPAIAAAGGRALGVVRLGTVTEGPFSPAPAAPNCLPPPISTASMKLCGRSSSTNAGAAGAPLPRKTP